VHGERVAELRPDEHIAETIAVHITGQRDGIAEEVPARLARELGVRVTGETNPASGPWKT
jgi:hypothetical protein